VGAGFDRVNPSKTPCGSLGHLELGTASLSAESPISRLLRTRLTTSLNVAALEASGDTHLLIWVRALELATHLARGDSEAAPGIADWLVETVRALGVTDVTVEVLAAAAAARLPEEARALLAELDQTPSARETPTTPDNSRRCCGRRWLRAIPSSLRGSLRASSRSSRYSARATARFRRVLAARAVGRKQGVRQPPIANTRKW
jgi:hypothetical protein